MNLKLIENIKNPFDDLQTNYLSLHEETIKSLSLRAFFCCIIQAFGRL